MIDPALNWVNITFEILVAYGAGAIDPRARVSILKNRWEEQILFFKVCPGMPNRSSGGRMAQKNVKPGDESQESLKRRGIGLKESGGPSQVSHMEGNDHPNSWLHIRPGCPSNYLVSSAGY